MEEKDLSKKLTWSGTYKGINFEIVNWSYKDPFMDKMKQIWNFYRSVSENPFPCGRGMNETLESAVG